MADRRKAEPAIGKNDIRKLFSKAVRYEEFKPEQDNTVRYEGVRIVLNFSRQDIPYSKVEDPILPKTLTGIANFLKTLHGMNYQGKSVAFAELRKNLQLTTGEASDKELYGFDFMYM